MLEQLLINRRIQTKDMQSFLEPDFSKGIHDPFLLGGMQEAMERIGHALKNKEKIGIFTDYDADGIPAGALLVNAFEKLGLKTSIYIPSRAEGYGLNEGGIIYLKKSGVDLIITADLGIRDQKNVEFARSLGLDVIITDHHEPGEKLPNALAIINPKLVDSNYPFRELSGGGVVFKFIQALAETYGKISQNDLKWMLDLVAITTICDMVPLVDENRIFSKFGLIVLGKTKRIGLQSLFEAAEIDQKNINTYVVGFQIGPRLNAPSRLNEKQDGFDLLMASNPADARQLAQRLNMINKRRQEELESIFTAAKKRIIDQKLTENKIICLEDERWPSGLIGLVAGKIMEDFSRPCVIFEKGKELSRGSARSIGRYNIVDALEKLSKWLVNFGGHSRAAGLTVKTKELWDFEKRLIKDANKNIADEDLIPILEVDAEFGLDDLNYQTLALIKKLEPFGLGNPRPVFALRRVGPKNIKRIGNLKKHLRFTVGEIQAIGFNFGEKENSILGKEVDIAFNLEENVWQGKKELQLKIVDIRF